ncbi:hypothetical protein K458DRAFT_279079, partial [Lentithecium fluviatile CBS 122367]
FVTLLTAILAFLPDSSVACKCRGQHSSETTQICCKEAKGNFINGVDCNAHSMSQRLSDFAFCCRERFFVKSDCGCP